MAENLPSKQGLAGSIPVTRSNFIRKVIMKDNKRKNLFADFTDMFDDIFGKWSFAGQKSKVKVTNDKFEFPEISLKLDEIPVAEVTFTPNDLYLKRFRFRMNKENLDKFIGKLVKIQKLMENTDKQE